MENEAVLEDNDSKSETITYSDVEDWGRGIDAKCRSIRYEWADGNSYDADKALDGLRAARTGLGRLAELARRLGEDARRAEAAVNQQIEIKKSEITERARREREAELRRASWALDGLVSQGLVTRNDDGSYTLAS